MNRDETRAFATRLMERVWKRVDSSEVPDLFEPHYDVAGRLADEDRFALRFTYSATGKETGAEHRSHVA